MSPPIHHYDHAGPSFSQDDDSDYSEDLQPELIQVLYASETGNAQDVAERIGREIRRRGGRCRVESMEDFDLAQLPHTPLLILITSTHGRGQPPPAMLPLWNALLRSGLPPDILEDVHFAVYGLGDSSYEKFCYSGKILARRMLSLGAQLIGSRWGNEDEGKVVENGGGMNDGCVAWGDERAPDGIEETLIPWIKKTMAAMLPLLPPPPSTFIPLGSTQLPPPLYALVPVDASSIPKPHTDDLVEGLHARAEGLSLSENKPTEDCLGEDVKGKEVGDMRGLGAGWGWAKLVNMRRATAQGWEQDVREVELELEDPAMHSYLPGAICSLKPETSPEEIQTFLRLSNLESQADIPLTIQPLNPDQPVPRHLPRPNTPTTLRHLLQHHLDLRCCPRKSFFEWLRRLSTSETEQERLDEFIADPDEIHTYADRPRRTVLETMADFRETKVPLTHVLEILSPLRRRQFSIASNAADHEGKVQLLIALVSYKTNMKIRRRGLLSSWLKDLPIGSRIPIKLEAPTLFLPTTPSTPVILVGPGTGVAPMRAFLEQRVREGEASNTALYFGCRSKDADLYFSEEWEAMREKGVKVGIACSQDQENKIYVQDRIKEDASMVYDWIYKRSGNIYISGSSNAMPKAVRAAVAWCLSTESSVGTLTTEEAESYVEQMFESGTRGGEESW